MATAISKAFSELRDSCSQAEDQPVPSGLSIMSAFGAEMDVGSRFASSR
jgi:hypothetical protein